MGIAKRSIRLSLAGFLATASLTVIALPKKAEAVTAANWIPGRIIDDVTFTDTTVVSAQQIQDFLNSKVPICDTSGLGATSHYSAALGRNYTRAEWGTSIGYPPPYTCLRDYYEVPKLDPGPGTPANNYGGQPIPAGAWSAAQLIWGASVDYRINPKVLLTTIQKESYGPLIVDDWPYPYQYTYAMGAHCPDGPNGAQCDPNYAGFSIQIRESARLMRYYLDNMNQPWWPYKKPGNNFVLWNVQSTGCGGGDVNITTMATAALYTYTPYQPNSAALNNMYGTGDGCSAYGNRNFWRIYNDWFGSPLDGLCGPTEPMQTFVRRFYHPKYFYHFYSARDCDVSFLKKLGFVNEGPVFNTTPADAPWAVPVYRYYNPQTGLHMWSTTLETPETLAAGGTGYKMEAGIVFYVVSPAMPGIHPVRQFYNPNTYLHLFAANPSAQEMDWLWKQAGFLDEGVSFYSQ